MMSQFVVHSMPGSLYGRAVFATLEEKHADYRLASVTAGNLQVRAASVTADNVQNLSHFRD